MTSSQNKPALIAGAGIGGLSLALALARKGIPVTILERAEIFSDIGAGIQLGPNATRILNDWGCEDALARYTASPDGIDIVKGSNNSVINHIILKPDAEHFFGSPYRTIHRADLHHILRDQLSHYDQAEIVHSFAASRYVQNADGSVTVFADDNREFSGRVLIGADGIWSCIRSGVNANITPRFSNKTAWRALVPMSDTPDGFAANKVRLYMGSRSHLVHYPVRQGEMLNIIAIINDPSEPDNLWDNTGDGQQLIEEMQHWSSDIQNFLSSITRWTKWPLYDMPAPKCWTDGSVALLGDAAHPALPFMAQGGVMAIEDADCLADCLADEPDDMGKALETYNHRRLARVKKVQNLSRRLGRIYHLTGPLAFVRNMVIANRTSKSLLMDYEWLYGWRGL